MFVNVLGIVAGIFTSFSLVPQLIKIVREKSGGDCSVWMFITLVIGIGMWVVYGILKADAPIIITNGFSFLANLAILVLMMVYRRSGARKQVRQFDEVRQFVPNASKKPIL